MERINEKSYDKGKAKKPTAQDIRKEIDMDEHLITLEELCKRYSTDPAEGLISREAEERLRQYGLNALSPPKDLPEIVKYLKQMVGPFALLLWTASVLSYIAYGLEPKHTDNLYIGVVLTCINLVTGTFTYLQEKKSSDTMKKFANLLPTYSQVKRDGHWTKVEAVKLVVGDVISMKSGDKVPADVRIISCHEFKVDNSSLTGEADPQLRGVENSHNNPLETQNLAFSGTLAVEGTAEAIVIRTGDSTMIGQIASLVAQTKKEETEINKEIKRFISYITVFAISIGFLFFILSGVVQGGFTLDTFVFKIGIIVANVPEGLPATVTVALALGAKRMSRRQVLVKHLEAIETLGAVTTICTDKTGTLTQNRMTVAHLWYDGQLRTSAIATEPGKEVCCPTHEPTFRVLQRCGTVCNRASFDKQDLEEGTKHILDWRTTGDASESALIKFFQPLRDIEDYRNANPQVFGVPFNSTNKYQLSIHKQEDAKDPRLVLLMKGAPERVFKRCSTIMVNGEEREVTPEVSQAFQEAYATIGGMGERVLGFAQAYLDPEQYGPDYPFKESKEEDGQSSFNFPTTKLCFIGLISLIDPPRPTVPHAVATCQRAGIRVIMVTGDHPLTAKAIAQQVGIIKTDEVEDMSDPDWKPMPESPAIVIPGDRIPQLTDEDWDRVFAKKQIVFARTSPKQKYIVVDQAQKRNEIVAVTGDGVNDSPALKKANIGVAMGITGSDVSKEAAGIILLDDNFASIVNGIEEGRLIYSNLKKSLAYTLPTNTAQLSPFLTFLAVNIPLPLSTILILLLDAGTDVWPAVALAYEKAETDIMDQPPRPRTERLVNKKMIAYSYLELGVIAALAGYFGYLVALNELGYDITTIQGTGFEWDDSDVLLYGKPASERVLDLRRAQSSYFIAVVLCKIACLIACSTRRLSLFQFGLTNKMVYLGILIQLAVTCIGLYPPPIQRVFLAGTVRADWWVASLPFALLLWGFDEGRKWLIRRYPGGWVERNTYY